MTLSDTSTDAEFRRHAMDSAYAEMRAEGASLRAADLRPSELKELSDAAIDAFHAKVASIKGEAP